MNSLNRLRMFTLLGELLTEQKGTYAVGREFEKIVADERADAYELGVKDKGKWDPWSMFN